MKHNLSVRVALMGLTILLSASCLNVDGPQSKYEAYVQVGYGPENSSQLETFLTTFFNGGKDSVSVAGSFSYGPVYHYAKVDEGTKTLQGGIAMCIGVDSLVAPDRRPARWAVCDKDGAHGGSFGYAVFHDTLSTLMPEHTIETFIPNDESTCKPYAVFVQNSHAVVEAVKYGVGLEGGPFGDDDWMDLTIKAFRKGASAGEKTVRLVSGKKPLEEWTEVDLSKMSEADAVDLSLTSSRPDMPLYVCLDDFIFYYLEIY